MLLSDGCIEDMNSLLMTTMVTNLSTIVGYDLDGNALKSVKIIDKKLQKGDNLLYSVCHELAVYIGIQKEQEVKSVHANLVLRGQAWGAHVNEPWRILCMVGTYIILSVGFQLTICALAGDAVLAIVRSGGYYTDNLNEHLSFTPMAPSLMYNQVHTC
jgi:hypothetical protein